MPDRSSPGGRRVLRPGWGVKLSAVVPLALAAALFVGTAVATAWSGRILTAALGVCLVIAAAWWTWTAWTAIVVIDGPVLRSGARGRWVDAIRLDRLSEVRLSLAPRSSGALVLRGEAPDAGAAGNEVTVRLTGAFYPLRPVCVAIYPWVASKPLMDGPTAERMRRFIEGRLLV